MLHKARLLLDDDPEACRDIEEQLNQPLEAAALAETYDLGLIGRLNSRDRELAKTHNRLGLICARLGDLDGAIGHYHSSARIWPGNEAAVTNLPILEQARADRGTADDAARSGGIIAQASMTNR